MDSDLSSVAQHLSSLSAGSSFSPREIVSELDRHIIGQRDAKRAVAIALRNRWRRQQLEEDMREEVLPKNILMIGPTGVGKTEISRRLAKLAGAPFIKVEATIRKRTSKMHIKIEIRIAASTLMKGAPASLASRREISVLPTPVGPIIRMFLGRTPRACPLRLLPAPAIAERNGDGALGIALADDVAVELRHDLAGGKRAPRGER